MLRDVKKVYPTSHAKSKPTRGTVATTFQHTRAHSIHRVTNHQNSPTRSGKVKSQHHGNTQSRELPRYLSRSARVIAGDTFHYPHHSTPTPEAKYTRKKHHPQSVQNTTREQHHSTITQYDVPIRVSHHHPTIGLLVQTIRT